jgi:hypothetical protein
MNRILILSALFLFAACGSTNKAPTLSSKPISQNNLEYADASPDVDALIIDESSVQAASAGAARQSSLPESSVASHVKSAVGDLNTAIKAALSQVKAMTALEPEVQSNGARVWTTAKNGLTYELTVGKRNSRYLWRLAAKKDADTTFSEIMKGYVKRKADGEAGRGAGALGIDLTAYEALAAGTDAAITQKGLVFAAFAHSGAGAHLVYRDTTTSALPISAYFSGHRVFSVGSIPALSFVRAGGRFNVSDFSDLSGPENETVVARLRRIVGVGGWGRALITGGNLPAGTRRVVRECWASPQTGEEVVYARRVWDCTSATDTATAPTCTLQAEWSQPAGALATDDPNAPQPTVFDVCFPNAAQALRTRLQNLAAQDSAKSLPENPAAADDSDETPAAAYPGEQQNPDNVARDDADASSNATSLESFDDAR